jgi:ribosomal protein L34E
MPCSVVKLPGGGVAIVRRAAGRTPRCGFCPARLRGVAHDGVLIEKATLLCDFEIGRTLGGEPLTCDAKVCVKCARREGEKDICPKHPK